MSHKVGLQHYKNTASHLYKRRCGLFCPKLGTDGSARCFPRTGSEAGKHDGCSPSPPQQTHKNKLRVPRKKASLTRAAIRRTGLDILSLILIQHSHGVGMHVEGVICRWNLFSCPHRLRVYTFIQQHNQERRDRIQISFCAKTHIKV